MKYAIYAVIFVLAGCASPTGKRAQELVITGVQEYCHTPVDARLLVRQAVNDGLHGEAQIKVVCKGDIE